MMLPAWRAASASLLLAAEGAGAVDIIGNKLRTAEENHFRLQNFWRLGEGFEGSASDWTEYVVWLVGVIGFLVYIGNPVSCVSSLLTLTTGSDSAHASPGCWHRIRGATCTCSRIMCGGTRRKRRARRARTGGRRGRRHLPGASGRQRRRVGARGASIRTEIRICIAAETRTHV